MKINDYYRETANINLNGSLLALFPVVLIVAGNQFFLKNHEILVFTIPFFLYSIICFQLYLFRKRQAIVITRNMANKIPGKRELSLFSAQHLLVTYMKTISPCVLFYFPNGDLAGTLKKCSGPGIHKTYALFDSNQEKIANFKVKRKRVIQVFDQHRVYLGNFEKTKCSWGKSKRELHDKEGRYVGAVEGSTMYMDEQIINQSSRQACRLRRGWMPLEWSPLFPEPNTPVLSFTGGLSEKDKILWMSFLINEYFIER